MEHHWKHEKSKKVDLFGLVFVNKAEWLNWQRKVIREERQELEKEKKRK